MTARRTGGKPAAPAKAATARAPRAAPAGKPPAPPHMAADTQVNFKVSAPFAELLAREAQAAGSMRRFVARLMRRAGYDDVPEADANPPEGRRRAPPPPPTRAKAPGAGPAAKGSPRGVKARPRG